MDKLRYDMLNGPSTWPIGVSATSGPLPLVRFVYLVFSVQLTSQ